MGDVVGDDRDFLASHVPSDHVVHGAIQVLASGLELKNVNSAARCRKENEQEKKPCSTV